jgi:hypothetical protein
MRYELAKQFSEFKLPEEIKMAVMQMRGSFNFAKAMVFADQVKLTNDDIDYFMAMKPQRQEDESHDDMKLRGKLSKALLKYRPYLYDYSVYNK